MHLVWHNKNKANNNKKINLKTNKFKMFKYLNYALFLTVFVTLFSCVPTRRFEAEVAARSAAESQAREAKALAK